MSMDTLLPTQPSSYKTLIKNSLRLYRVSFSKVIFLSCLLSLVVFIPRILAEIIGQDIFLTIPLLSIERLWILLIDLASIIFFVGIIWRMYGVIRGFHEPLIEDLKVGVKKVFFVFIASFIESAIVVSIIILIYSLFGILHEHNLLFNTNLIGMIFTTLAFLGQIILIFYVYTLFVFLIPVITIENKGIIGAIERSVYLVWNHWWRVFSVQFTPWFCFLIFLFILRDIFHINVHIFFFHHTVAPFVTLFQFIIFAIFIPWVAATLLVQLKDLELRKKLTT